MANFEASIPWLVLRKWLLVWREDAWRKMAKARGEERDTIAGAAQVFDELMNLPETLAALEGKEEHDDAQGNRPQQG